MGAATDDLKKEHEAILHVLKLTEKMKFSTGQIRDSISDTYRDVAEFFSIFGDKCHHGKEENFLFPAMVELGIVGEGGPVGALLAEHKSARELTRRMRECAKSDDDAGFEAAVENYSKLMRRHIERENTVFFAMADFLIDEAEQQQMFLDFEKFERDVMGEGVHERLHHEIEAWEAVFDNAGG